LNNWTIACNSGGKKKHEYPVWHETLHELFGNEAAREKDSGADEKSPDDLDLLIYGTVKTENEEHG